MDPKQPHVATDVTITSVPNSGSGRDLFVCLAAALVVYLSGLGNGFTYDDKAIVESNPRIQALDRIPEIWQTHWWLDPNVDESYGIHQLGDRLYRPLSMTSFSLNYAVHGLQPFGYMLVNLLLHVLATGLVWRLTWNLIGDRWVALVAGLLFAVHPVHAEVVANVVGRVELLSAVFTLLGLLALLPREGLPGWPRGLLAAACCLLALFAKESAICTAPLVLIVLFYRLRQLGRWPTLGWSAMQVGFAALPALIYLPVRYYALGGALIRKVEPSFLMNPLTEATPLARLYGVFSIAGHYVRLLVSPIKLSCDYSYAVITNQPVITGMTILGVAGAVALAVALTGWLRKSVIWRQVAMLATMFLASYALISNVFIHIGVTVAERLMYWPSAPVLMLFAVLVVSGFRKLAATPDANPGVLRLLRLGGIGLLIAFGFRTAVRAPEWSSNDLLFITDAQTEPRSAKLANMAAGSYYRMIHDAADPEEKQKYIEAGSRLADHALEILPSDSDAMQTRALLYYAAGDRDKALEFLDAAATLTFNDAKIREIMEQIRDPNRAEHLAKLRKQIEGEPQRPDLLLTYGEALLAAQDPVPALKIANRLVKLTPDSLEAHWLRARAALASLEFIPAVESLKRVIEMDPNRWEAHTNLSFALLREEALDVEGALAHAKEAIRLAPRRLETHNNYAQVLLTLNRTDEAIKELEFILASPDFPHDNPLYSTIKNQLQTIKRNLNR